MAGKIQTVSGMAIYVLFGGLTSSMGALGAALLTAEEAKDPKA